MFERDRTQALEDSRMQDDNDATSLWQQQKPRGSSGCTECKGALQLSKLRAGEELTISTKNSSYRLFLIDPNSARVLVKGGRNIKSLIESTFWGSFDAKQLCPGKLCIGQRLRFDRGSTCYLTSRVVAVERDSARGQDAPPDRLDRLDRDLADND